VTTDRSRPHPGEQPANLLAWTALLRVSALSSAMRAAEPSTARLENWDCILDDDQKGV
jgi:hypothetical protein